MIRGALLVALSLAVLIGSAVWQWGPNLGDGPSTVCLARPAPAAVETDLGWAPEARASWWPLGVTCRWTRAGSGETVERGPGPGPTGVAVAALGTGLIGGALVVRDRRFRRRGAVNPGR